MRFRFIVCAATLALVAGACGSDEATTVVEPTGAEEAARDAPAESPTSSAAASETSPTTEDAAPEAGAQTADEGAADDSAAPVPALAGPGDVPDLGMVNVHTGATVNLQTLVTGETPLLFWFWAPH